MSHFITRLLISALALGIAASVVPGFHIAHWWTLLIAGAVHFLSSARPVAFVVYSTLVSLVLVIICWVTG